MKPCWIGLDLGTSGCRAVALDARGTRLARAARALPSPNRPAPGHAEQDPHLWWEATLAVLGELTTALPRHRPRALAVDGTSATLLLCRGDLTPLGPALMYDDQRAAAQARRLAHLAPAHSPAAAPSSSLAKLLWLLDQGHTAAGLRACHQADWIAARLAGRPLPCDENNALKLGYDPVAGAWAPWLDGLKLPAGLLPEVAPPGTPLASLDPAVSRLTGLPPDCRIVAGTTDSTAAALAVGLDQPGQAVTSLGSTLVMKVVSRRPRFDGAMGIYSHRIPGDLWLVGGASNSGGRVLRKFFSDEELPELSRRIRPDRGLCLDYYPLPAPGERFPVANPRLAPRLSPVPRDRVRFLQGLLEGMARIEARAYALLADPAEPTVGPVHSLGGGAANPAWRAIRARILQRPVSDDSHREAAEGAARLALRGVPPQGD